ncbi:DctP family TRAP transporter solute-binding subunit [Desulfovibrio sp. OttesenSCG-928-C14]|nr:DctP family TRAP transporter solute-binding subunit [Desulfovibrio sp. OttesenSCG-928-C14]
MRKVFIALMMVVVLAMASAPAFAAKYKKEYKLDIVPSLNTGWGMGAAYFADLVRERSNGRINIKVYPNSQLTTGKQTNAFMLLRNGTIDFAVQSTINYSPQIPELNLFALPFFIAGEPNRYKAMDAILDGEGGKLIAQAIEKKGGKFIAFGENGFRELTNSKKEIRKPSDLVGMKIRVVGSPLFIDIFKALGANPQAMAWSDTMSAIQQGVIDGQENPVNTFYPLRVTDYHKYITNWHYMADPTLFVVNPGVWKSFDKADQEIIIKAAKEAGQYQKALARIGLDENDKAGANMAYLKKLNRVPEVTDWYTKLRGEGVTMTDLTPAETKEFVEKTKGVINQWESKIGKKLIETARADMAKVR